MPQKVLTMTEVSSSSGGPPPPQPPAPAVKTSGDDAPEGQSVGTEMARHVIKFLRPHVPYGMIVRGVDKDGTFLFSTFGGLPAMISPAYTENINDRIMMRTVTVSSRPFMQN